MPELATRTPAPTPVRDTVPLPPKVPQLPDELFQRFPSLRKWQEDENRWWSRSVAALQDNNRDVSQNVTKNAESTRNLRVTFNQFSAEITEEVDAIADEQGAQAKRIITVSAMAGVAQHIKVQSTEPVGPSINDYWIDTSVPTLPITYQWDGADWVEVTTPISAAAVSDERTARVTADGYLEGKYTLTVVAGTVITGFNITSASGPGTNVSNVAWTANQFQIYSGTTNKVMFVSDAIQDKVRIAGVLTVDGASTAVYVRTAAGAGSYNDANTFWFVDSAGRMSLKQKFLWDGSNLTIDGSGTFTGSITASSGAIGGWNISASTLSNNNAILDSAGQLVLGTSNDIVYLSATDATYRIWIGNATAGSAAFRVTKTGIMTATNGVFSGTITSSSGTIGGFTIGATSLSATNIAIDSTGSSVAVGSSGNEAKLVHSGGIGELIISYSGSTAVELGTAGGGAFLSLIPGAASAALYLGDTVFRNFAAGVANLYGTLAFTSADGVAGDTNLYRNAANELKTDDDFTIGGTLKFGTHSAIGAETLTGFVTFKDSGGTTRKLAIIS